MPLKEYRRKRHFDRTSEPAGHRLNHARSHWRFVIQKHAARRLHYDFRLEHDGVLKSWAVPNGPCLDPSQRRLAVEVEDHPLEYGKFEGIIPAGEYGGGTVLLWDHGFWSTDQNVQRALRTGKLKFQLVGEKLTGTWNLVRMRSRAGDDGKVNWLLIKERDDAARPLSKTDILDDRPESVLSGRTIGEIAKDADRTWHSKQNGDVRAKRPRKPPRRAKAAISKAVPGARRAPFPQSIEPQLATLVDAPPKGKDWVHEIKLDGYRILAHIDRAEATLRTRKQIDWTHRFSEISDVLSQIAVKQAVIDGEIVALRPNGASDFQMLQSALGEGATGRLVYFAFDLLYLDGFDLRTLPLEQRKARLAQLIESQPSGRIRYSDHLAGSGKEIVAECCQLGLEGIVSKLRDAPYSSGRGSAWLKTKCAQRQEFVIGGFTDSTSSRKRLGALLIGYFDRQGRLIYSGKVGSGFSAAGEEDLRQRLKARGSSGNPFATSVSEAHPLTTHWVKPELVAEIKYSNWTGAGYLRQPVFQGLREDKPAREVVLERTSNGAPEAAEPTAGRTTVKRKRRAAPSTKAIPPKSAARSTPSPRRKSALTPAQLDELKYLKLTHPDRILYPDAALTKQDLVVYYAEAGPWILPHVIDRPLSLVRCPQGQGGECFYQKHASSGTPAALERVMIREKNKSEPYLAVHDMAGLLSLVQMGVLEIHPWGSRSDDVEKPDRLIFDLDPDPSVAWDAVISAAKELRERLVDLGLESFAKTTGGKGLHLVVPIQRRYTWPQVKQFCRAIATRLAGDAPHRFTANMSKAARHGKIYVDYLRNDRGATAIAPYSTRSRAGAPVATPLRWSEVSPRIHADHFHVGNVRARLASLKSDPWEDFATLRQSLNRDMFRRLDIS